MSRHVELRSLTRVLTSPMFLLGALIGLVVVLAWTFWPAGAGDEMARDGLGGEQRSMASVAFLFLKAPVAMVAGGLLLDFISRRLSGRGGA
jgi:hypothetical protein